MRLSGNASLPAVTTPLLFASCFATLVWFCLESYARVKLNFNPSSRPTRGANCYLRRGKKKGDPRRVILLFAMAFSREREKKTHVFAPHAINAGDVVGYFTLVKSAYGPLGRPDVLSVAYFFDESNVKFSPAGIRPGGRRSSRVSFSLIYSHVHINMWTNRVAN